MSNGAYYCFCFTQHMLDLAAAIRGQKGGEMKCMAKPLDTSGKHYLYFTAWMDSKSIHMLHTTMPYQQTVQRAKERTHQKAVPFRLFGKL